MRYMVKTLLPHQEALEQAKAYFGPGGKGLTMTSEHKRALKWEGGNGHVNVIVKSVSPTLLEIDTRAWEEAVRLFITHLPRQQPWWARWWRRNRALKFQAPAPTAQ